MDQKTKRQIEDIEISLLCEGIFLRYGFDFRDYARASLKRRVISLVQSEELSSVSFLQDRILRDQKVMEQLLLNLSINVTAMFRDPSMYMAFRQHVIPLLRTYPYIRLWHAGCSSGEEVYSMAILLHEEGLADRCKIYATDMNEAILKKAKAGVFPLSTMQEYTHNYINAGGRQSFSDYYTAKYNHAIVRPELKKNIVFSKHNLVTDRSFNEFNVIFCRNVMIYFNECLQACVHELFYESLCRFGILVLGNKESMRLSPLEENYEALHSQHKIYRRRA